MLASLSKLNLIRKLYVINLLLPKKMEEIQMINNLKKMKSISLHKENKQKCKLTENRKEKLMKQNICIHEHFTEFYYTIVKNK